DTDTDTEDIINNISLIKKKKAAKPLTELSKQIENYSNNVELQQALKDFLKMRKAIKSPLTDRALELCLNKLNKYAADDETKIAIINQSIVNSWKGLFPLKEEQSNTEPVDDIEKYKSVINKFLY
ncbi:MAG: hypothetical protein J6S85_16420, partial [Methanobrevibacter sp.]|nr:hypothetical protein [Methanobrevibacter sp.]